jgi:predicted dehydrogenase
VSGGKALLSPIGIQKRLARRDELRLAVAGCGRIVERGYVPAALATPGVSIVAFADPEPERLRQCRQLWEQGGGTAAEGFEDTAELLAAEPPDALVVAAPAATHGPIAAAAAAAGVPCLVEKPPAPDAAGARGLAALSPPPFLAFNRRFLQGVELRSRVPAEGWLELDLELRFRATAWSAHVVRDDALLDAGVHLIDLATHLSAAAPICVRRAEVSPERAAFELDLSRGRARISCATDRRHRESVEIRDRAGSLLARNRQGGIRGRLGALSGAPHPLVLSLGRQLSALRNAVQLGEVGSLGSAADGVAALTAVESVRRSAELGGAEVTVALPTEAPA